MMLAHILSGAARVRAQGGNVLPACIRTLRQTAENFDYYVCEIGTGALEI